MISGKVLLLSTGALSAAVALQLSAPAMSVFLFSEVPRIYRALLVWLTPPYLYLVINGIIISIAASSRFQKPVSAGEENTEAAPPVKVYAERRPEDPPPPVVFEVGNAPEEEEEGGQEGFLLPLEGYNAGEGGADGMAAVVRDTAAEEEAGEEEEEEEEEFVISRSSWTPEMRLPTSEKPLVSLRFVTQRAVKGSPEGRALGVAKPRRYETLESTWKTITDGRPMPLARHLKKSDTWAADGGGRARDEAPPTPPMRKYETLESTWKTITDGRPMPLARHLKKSDTWAADGGGRARDEAPPTPPMRKSDTFGGRRVASPSPSLSGSGGGSGGRLLRREASPGQDELNRRVEAFIRKFNEEMRLQRQESFKNYIDMINRATH